MRLLKGSYSYLDGSDDTEDYAVVHRCLPCHLFRDRVRGWRAGLVNRRISWQSMRDFRYRQLHDPAWY